MTIYAVNPEKEQDRVSDLIEMFDNHNRSMFPQQEAVYNNLAEYLLMMRPPILEAGCGTGLGTAILERSARVIIGTDKVERNVDFAKAIYPWITFGVWDITEPTSLQSSVVVCIEAFEHVAYPQQAMNNLLDATGKTLWLSTPNGSGQSPPSNPYHVHEYTTQEMLALIPNTCTVKIRHWETWEILQRNTKADPLVYEIKKRVEK